MTWFGYVFVCLMALNAAMCVANVGRPREPMSPGAALTVLVVNGLIVWGAIAVGTVQP